MSKSQNEKNPWGSSSYKNIILKVIFILACLFIIVNLFFYPYMLINENAKIDKLEEKIVLLNDEISQLTSLDDNDGSDVITNNNTTENEYQQMISFLENEAIKQREFSENQRQFIVWMMGVIGAAAVFIMGIVGFTNKKDIQAVVEKEYEDFVQNQFDKKLSEALGSDDRIEYLRTAVENQKKISEKKVLFIYQNDESKFEEVDKIIRDRGAKTYKKSVDKIIKDGKVLLDEYRDYIIIFEVNAAETNKKNNSADAITNTSDKNGSINSPEGSVDNPNGKEKTTCRKKDSSEEQEEYMKIYEKCKNDMKCLFYVEDGEISNDISKHPRMSYAKTIVTLYSTLSKLLEM